MCVAGYMTRRVLATSPLTHWEVWSVNCSLLSQKRNWRVSWRNLMRMVLDPWTLMSSVRWWWPSQNKILLFNLFYANKSYFILVVVSFVRMKSHEQKLGMKRSKRLLLEIKLQQWRGWTILNLLIRADNVTYFSESPHFCWNFPISCSAMI